MQIRIQQKVTHRHILGAAVGMLLVIAVFCLCACSQASPIVGEWYQRTSDGMKILTIDEDLGTWTLTFPDGRKRTGYMDYDEGVTEDRHAGRLVIYLGHPSYLTGPNDALYQKSSEQYILYYSNGNPKGDRESATAAEIAAQDRASQCLEGSASLSERNIDFSGMWYRNGSPYLKG